jgi:CubicO group peptidase (beta-lactamase class C family)
MVIFHKTYGYHTYDSRIDVRKQDLYDLASVTKVSGPLSGLMLLEGMGKFSHLDRLGDYAPYMKGSDKADLELRDILAHQAGLYPYLLYWENTVKKTGDYKRRFLRNSPSEKFSVQIADHIYLKSTYRKKIYREIKKSALGEKKYVYSGLSFLLFPEIIEDLSGERYEDFLSENIYHPLGAWDLVFNPNRFYPRSRIAPTEMDTLFRRQLVHGYVHDEAAAMMGGFSGNAGLFSTANDLLKLFEMYRRMGNYGGEQLIAGEVIERYSSCQFPENKNRRGLGFDKPSLGDRDGTKNVYPCPGASPSSFGHSGFTGTFAWVDPEYEISYVFLCNRVYPTRENDLLTKMNIRTAILQSLYDSINEKQP